MRCKRCEMREEETISYHYTLCTNSKQIPSECFLSEMGNKAKIVSKTEAEVCLSFNNLHSTMFRIATWQQLSQRESGVECRK